MISRIELIGPMGCGKTTLIENIEWRAIKKNIVVVKEDLSPIIAERRSWEKDPIGKSYFIQSVYYVHRLNQINAARNIGRKDAIFLCDYGLLCDHYVYSQTMNQMRMLSDMEYSGLERLFSYVYESMPKLKAIIYKKCSLELLLDRYRNSTSFIGNIDDMRNMFEIMIDNCAKTIKAHYRVPTLVIDEDILSEERETILKKIRLFLNNL